jgi:hypothetical protein
MPQEDAMSIYDPSHLDESSNRYFGQRKKAQDAAANINLAINNALNELSADEERRTAFLGLLSCVRERSALLKATLGQGSAGWVAPVFLINRLKNVAERHRFWLRSCETWAADCGNLRPLFHSLVHHLFAQYPVPHFIDSVWDLPTGPEAFRQQSWSIRLGRGDSLRSLNLPITLTRRMEHHARRAPDHYTVMQALRYGEMRGLGGGERLAREVAASRLGRDLSHAAFWRTVLMFLAARPELPLQHVGPIIDFIHANKFAGEEVLTATGLERRTAPWPQFSIHGRTTQSLLRMIGAWRLEFGGTDNDGCAWRESGIRAYRYVEQHPGEMQLDWSIVELLNSSALYAEGRAMHHCVYTYLNKCVRGDSTIWSLRLRADGQEKRKATIEVNPHRRAIVQVRAKCNRRPGHRATEVIRQWAAWAGVQCEKCE